MNLAARTVCGRSCIYDGSLGENDDKERMGCSCPLRYDDMFRKSDSVLQDELGLSEEHVLMTAKDAMKVYQKHNDDVDFLHALTDELKRASSSKVCSGDDIDRLLWNAQIVHDGQVNSVVAILPGKTEPLVLKFVRERRKDRCSFREAALMLWMQCRSAAHSLPGAGFLYAVCMLDRCPETIKVQDDEDSSDGDSKSDYDDDDVPWFLMVEKYFAGNFRKTLSLPIPKERKDALILTIFALLHAWKKSIFWCQNDLHSRNIRLDVTNLTMLRIFRSNTKGSVSVFEIPTYGVMPVFIDPDTSVVGTTSQDPSGEVSVFQCSKRHANEASMNPAFDMFRLSTSLLQWGEDNPHIEWCGPEVIRFVRKQNVFRLSKRAAASKFGKDLPVPLERLDGKLGYKMIDRCDDSSCVHFLTYEEGFGVFGSREVDSGPLADALTSLGYYQREISAKELSRDAKGCFHALEKSESGDRILELTI